MEHIEQQVSKTQENKDEISKDLADKKVELADLEHCLQEVDSRQQHYFIKCRLYRKSELMDLIGSVNKLEHDDELYNEMQMKKEKMQNELALIEEELFDMMKNQSKEIENILKEQEEMEIDSEDNARVQGEDQSQSS